MNASSPAVSGMRYDERPRSFTRPMVTTVILIMLVIMIIRDVLARRRRLAGDLRPEPGTAIQPPQPDAA
jgi:hypothetical protein